MKYIKLTLLFLISFSLFATFCWKPAVRLLVPDAAGFVRAALAGDGGAFLARDGTLLRLFTSPSGDIRLDTPLASFSPILIDALLAAEDRSFFSHGGFDLAAICRAAWDNLLERRVVSGASTITQQVMRISRPRPRTLAVKISELFLAARLEQQMSKQEILSAYLNLAPMAGNLRGGWAGACLLFGREPAALDLAQAATLAALPQSPSRLNPWRPGGAKRLKARRNWVLSRMAKLNLADQKACSAASRKPLGILPWKLPLVCPHFTDWMVAETGTPTGRLVTTIDIDIQRRLESVLKSHRSRLARSGARQAAGLVIDAPSMSVLAMAGSQQWSPETGGFNNGCTARRSGGSILKPFLYALALEKGFSASSVISDTLQTFRTPQGDYLPVNADRRSYGPITVRSALGNSLNITAVKMLNALGGKTFYRLLSNLGLLPPDESLADIYGLGLAIGNPELSMTSVAAAYGMLAHAGRRVSLQATPGPASISSRIVSDATAWITLEMLADPSARLLTFGNPQFFSFPFPVAIKTGTSTNYRDAWLFGVTPRYIVGLWAGNFDGAPTYGLSGATACGPMAHDLLTELHSDGMNGWFRQPSSVVTATVCGISGNRPTRFCPVRTTELFVRGSEPFEECRFHERQGRFHELPPEYAGWLQARGISRTADPFVLEGGLEIGDPLAPLPGGHPDGPGVHLRNPASPTSPIASSSGVPPSSPVASGSGRLRVSSLDSDSTGWGRISIVSPHDGDRFVRSPDEENLVRLRAIPEAPLSEVIWLVDGVETARVGPPYEAFWQMQPGAHTITVLSPGEEAAQIHITIE